MRGVQAKIGGVRRSELLDVGRGLGDHCLVHGRADVDPAISLGKRHDPDRQRSPTADFRQRRAAAVPATAPEPDQLRRPPADVEQDRAFGLGIEQWRAAACRKRRFGRAIDDLEFEANDAGKRVDHPEAVAGGTRDQQPAIVGPEIEGRIGGPPIGALGRNTRPAPTPRRP